MKFWFSGELDHRIVEAYRPVRTHVEARLNTRCGNRHYGDAVKEIAIIPIILGPEFLKGRRERRLWQRKQRTADYRMIIDFEKFKLGDEVEREHLLVANTLDAVHDLQRKIRDGFDGASLATDIMAEFPRLRRDQAHQATGADLAPR